MNITYPYLGNSPLAFKNFLEAFGHTVVLPYRPSKRTLDLGVKYAPEFACLPLKIVLGTFIEGLERGADTLVTTGGVGPCRAGQYAQIQEKILRDLGYEFEMIVFEPPRRDFCGVARNIKYLTNRRPLSEIWRAGILLWQKLKLCDDLERLSHRIRPRETVRGKTSKAYQTALDIVHAVKTAAEVKEAGEKAFAVLRSVPQDRQRRVLRIGMVGEIYVLLEPAANLEMEEMLGEMGVWLDRSMFLSGWTGSNVVLDMLRMTGEKDVKRAAAPYLPEMIGGHGQDSVGHTVLYSRQGYDGVIQIAPFTCIPEIVAKSILTKISRERQIPVLTVFFDEQTGKAGLQTRLEAFADLLRRRKDKKEAIAG
ncbi:MAG: CoA protein activase [bacterium]|jgi:predicted nucleotide-binding protein (sugar kinase/HSP70/actin superfamily)